MPRWGVRVGVLLLCAATRASAQQSPPDDSRAQFPAFLNNSYFGFNVGSIRYGFSGQQLEPGFQAQVVDVPHLAVRVDLFGHRITKHVSAVVTYMRPARFVTFQNVNGDLQSHQISTAYGGLTIVGDMPLGDRFSGYAEGGWGVTSRPGFNVNGAVALQDAHFAAGLLGLGIAYHATQNFDLMLGATYSPGRKSFDQPSTRLFTSGLRYRISSLPDAEVEDNRDAGYAFPANVVRLGYTSNLLDYGVNDFFSKTVPIFWGGNVLTRQGFTLDYERNVFHSKNWFAFDLGASASYWNSNGTQQIFRTLSVYPLFRFFAIRTDPADFYLAYSLAGPTYLSQSLIDGRDTGEHFTFQDFMGVGTYVGATRRMNVELGIKHYSNGNIFTRNASIKVPLTLSVGLAF
jgi:hypothetical protein